MIAWDDFEISASEASAISFVRQWSRAAHVHDPDGLAALDDGRGVFDVSEGALRLEKFIAKNKLESLVHRTDDDTARHILGSPSVGTIYFAHKMPGA